MRYPLSENDTDQYPVVPEHGTTLVTIAFTITTMLAAFAARKNKTRRGPQTSSLQWSTILG
jgi:hypothetical protein